MKAILSMLLIALSLSMVAQRQPSEGVYDSISVAQDKLAYQDLMAAEAQFKADSLLMEAKALRDSIAYHAAIAMADSLAAVVQAATDEADSLKQLQREEKDDTTVFKIVEKMPHFPGGEEALRVYLKYNARDSPKDNDIEGTVYVQFVVTKTGAVKDAKIVRGLDKYSDEEALRLVNSLPAFIPGKQNGKEVNVMYIVPVRFKLN